MKNKTKQIQILLVFIGVFLIVITYFYNPNNKPDKVVVKKEDSKKLNNNISDNTDTFFEYVEYKGLYDLNKPFTITSDKAHAVNEEPDVMYMTNMHFILNLNDGRVVEIKSKKGTYNKKTYDCFFKEDVKATDGEIKIFAQNLELLASENTATIYQNVNVLYPEGSLKADKVNYNFETKSFKVSMFNDKFVKMKVMK